MWTRRETYFTKSSAENGAKGFTGRRIFDSEGQIERVVGSGISMVFLACPTVSQKCRKLQGCTSLKAKKMSLLWKTGDSLDLAIPAGQETADRMKRGQAISMVSKL